jgi:hypothetical protein
LSPDNKEACRNLESKTVILKKECYDEAVSRDVQCSKYESSWRRKLVIEKFGTEKVLIHGIGQE